MRAANDLLFQGAGPAALRIEGPRPVGALYATMLDSQTIKCGEHVVHDEHPLITLCERLVAAGKPDGMLIIRAWDRAPLCTEFSIHECARVGRRKP